MDDRTNRINQFHPVRQTITATFFTWGVTDLEAALVFVFCGFNQKLLDAMMFVVIEELIPEFKLSRHTDVAIITRIYRPSQRSNISS